MKSILVDMSEERFSEILTIAQKKLDSGAVIDYIHLEGDPNRQRNHAGIWVKKLDMGNKIMYEGKIVGRFLGKTVQTSMRQFFTLHELLERLLIIWESSKFPPA
jgi:hypothetical protein